MVRRDPRNGYQKDIYFKEIELRGQNMITILGSLVNILDGTYMIIH